MGAIPIVDLRDYRSGSDAAQTRFVETLRSGLSEFGFTVVEGHAIDPDLIRRVYSHFEAFSGQGEESKRECSGVAGGQRGFTAFGIEHAKDQSQPDLKEFFHVGQNDVAAPEIPANVWPRQLPGLRPLALIPTSVLATGGLPQHWLIRHWTTSTSKVRLCRGHKVFHSIPLNNLVPKA